MIEVERPAPVGVAHNLQAVVLDWAGTTVDFGSRAPVQAIVAAFEQWGIAISESDARRPMGLAKRDHLAELLRQPDVVNQYREEYGRDPGNSDLDSIYENFLAHQAECIVTSSAVIPGCTEAVAACRRQGLKIGSSTGYTRELLELVARRAATEGYVPDVMLSADDVSPGRPAPWLCIENARRLGVYPLGAVVKVDDTPAGVTAGRNAGAWSVGVVASGNEVGLSAEALAALSKEQQTTRLEAARGRLTEAGAHLLIDTIAELPLALERITAKLAGG